MGAKSSSSISRRAVENALHAERFARETGRAFNRSVVINFARLGLDEEEGRRVFRQLRKSVAGWWRYQRTRKHLAIGDPLGLHTFASPRGSFHVDWLLHVPEAIEPAFDALVRNRLVKLLGRDDLGTEPHIKQVTRPVGRTKYALKGVDPAFAAHYFIKHKDEGVVYGRRASVTRAASKARRKQAGWTRRRRPKDR